MNVLILGLVPFPLRPIIEKSGCSVFESNHPAEVEYLQDHSIDCVVSYRYRYLIRQPIIEYTAGNIINLHISLLPWNRGADPNLWSFLEDTPKGVTIHYIDEGLDTGDIIAQRAVVFDVEKETLATSYHKLNKALIDLFEEQWALIIHGRAKRRKQPLGGSYHRAADKKKFEHLLSSHGWDTPVKELIRKALNR